MPIFRYECPKCEMGCEVIQKADGDAPQCEDCNVPMERSLTTAALSFKGGGWADDGYASSKGEGQGISAKDMGEGMMQAARDGAKEGGHVEGERRVREFQEKVAKDGGTG